MNVICQLISFRYDLDSQIWTIIDLSPDSEVILLILGKSFTLSPFLIFYKRSRQGIRELDLSIFACTNFVLIGY